MKLPWKKEEFEGIEYEPVSVKELLTEMKDVSELMVDLAYSAVVFDSKEIGEEVSFLESKMDKLKYQIRMGAMLAARNPDEAEQLTGILQVASAAETISNAAGDIVKILDIEVEKRPFLPNVLSQADEKINTLVIYPTSNIVGKRLGELNTEAEAGVRVIAIRRKKHWTYDPEDDHMIKSGDVFIVSGVHDGFERLKDAALGKTDWEVGS